MDDPRRDRWCVPEPLHLPRPTWWPAAAALGVTLTFWGLVASLFILAVGLLLATASLVAWVGEIRHDHAPAGRGVTGDET